MINISELVSRLRLRIKSKSKMRVYIVLEFVSYCDGNSVPVEETRVVKVFSEEGLAQDFVEGKTRKRQKLNISYTYIKMKISGDQSVLLNNLSLYEVKSIKKN